jgi:uncharacterized protein YkvS
MSNRTFVKYEPTATYIASIDQHGPTVGQIGHGAIVKFADGETGIVIASNTERALVDYGRERDWFRNDLLMVDKRFTV